MGDVGKERTITNVAAGRIGPGSTDAVNGSELYAVKQQVGLNSTAIQNINNRMDSLDNRINKVGAGAAALAMLHPLDFDPDENGICNWLWALWKRERCRSRCFLSSE